MRLVRFEKADGPSVEINPEFVVAVETAGQATLITSVGFGCLVKEDLATVARQIRGSEAH